VMQILRKRPIRSLEDVRKMVGPTSLDPFLSF
jgi:hypothetical protein